MTLGTKALMHLDTGHPGHADVGNQAGGMGGLPGCKKFFCLSFRSFCLQRCVQ
jgi:hypothetical protein